MKRISVVIKLLEQNQSDQAKSSLLLKYSMVI